MTSNQATTISWAEWARSRVAELKGGEVYASGNAILRLMGLPEKSARSLIARIPLHVADIDGVVEAIIWWATALENFGKLLPGREIKMNTFLLRALLKGLRELMKDLNSCDEMEAAIRALGLPPAPAITVDLHCSGRLDGKRPITFLYLYVFAEGTTTLLQEAACCFAQTSQE